MIIDEQEDRELWLVWTIEFMRRGLMLDGDIDVHGPHEWPGDLLWGDAWCKGIDGMKTYVEFSTPRGKTGKYDTQGLRIEECPVLPVRSLPTEWRTKIRQMRQELKRRRRRT